MADSTLPRRALMGLADSAAPPQVPEPSTPEPDPAMPAAAAGPAAAATLGGESVVRVQFAAGSSATPGGGEGTPAALQGSYTPATARYLRVSDHAPANCSFSQRV